MLNIVHYVVKDEVQLHGYHVQILMQMAPENQLTYSGPSETTLFLNVDNSLGQGINLPVTEVEIGVQIMSAFNTYHQSLPGVMEKLEELISLVNARLRVMSEQILTLRLPQIQSPTPIIA